MTQKDGWTQEDLGRWRMKWGGIADVGLDDEGVMIVRFHSDIVATPDFTNRFMDTWFADIAAQEQGKGTFRVTLQLPEVPHVAKVASTHGLRLVYDETIRGMLEKRFKFYMGFTPIIDYRYRVEKR